MKFLGKMKIYFFGGYLTIKIFSLPIALEVSHGQILGSFDELDDFVVKRCTFYERVLT